MTTIIFGLILTGLLSIGVVQCFRYVKKGYHRTTDWVHRLKKAMRTIDAVPMEPMPRQELQAKTAAAEPIIPEQFEPKIQDDKLQEQIDVFSIQMDGLEEGQYAQSESVTSDELTQLSRTVSVSTAPIEQEIAAAKTVTKIKNTPLLDAFLGATGNRVQDMFSNVTTHVAALGKNGFDYSKFITK